MLQWKILCVFRCTLGTHTHTYIYMYVYTLYCYLRTLEKMSGMFDVSIRHEVIQRDDLVRTITSDDVSWCFLLLQPL